MNENTNNQSEQNLAGQPLGDPLTPPPGKKANKFIIIGAAVGVLLIIIAAAAFVLTGDLRAYAGATKSMNEESYQDAYDQFKALGDYRDSKKLKAEAEKGITYQEGIAFKDKAEYEEALDRLTDLDFKDSEEQVDEITNLLARQLLDEGQIESAMSYVTGLDNSESAAILAECQYKLAQSCYEEGDHETALSYLEGLDYEGSEELIEQIHNSKYSLQQFVKRYNETMLISVFSYGHNLEVLSEDMFAEPKTTLSSNATLSLNTLGEAEDYKNKITNAKYEVTWKDLEEDIVSAETLGVIAAMTPDYTVDDINEIMDELSGSAGTCNRNGIEYKIYASGNSAVLEITIQ